MGDCPENFQHRDKPNDPVNRIVFEVFVPLLLLLLTSRSIKIFLFIISLIRERPMMMLELMVGK
jgi:hypothetical protein